jgi:5-methylcytosine-specific restriction protein A
VEFPPTPSAQTLFEEVLSQYTSARDRPFANDPMGELLRHRLPNVIGSWLSGQAYDVNGSPGKGNWAETPWVAVFDPLVTDTATKGYYVVYLFRGDGRSVFLSLNQATTAVQDRVGRRYRDVLERTAQVWRNLLPDDAKGTLGGPIDLGGQRPLTRGYEAGNIAAIEYQAGAVPPDDVLAGDLKRLLGLYGHLVAARDALAEATQASEEEGTTDTGTEGDRFRWHKRVERNARLARAAKAVHGTTCQACGFSFEDAYGELGTGYIEAHHLVPVAELAGRPRKVNATHDFAVVCANCHRMLHRRAGRALTIAELGELVDRHRLRREAGEPGGAERPAP